MFTVKVCYEDDVSRERILTADTVESAFPASCEYGYAPKLGVYDVPPYGIVVLGNPSDGAKSMAFTFGTIFVMNEQGATVSKYKLATTKSMGAPRPLDGPKAKAA